MDRRKQRYTGSYQCRYETRWSRLASVGISTGIVLSVLLVGNVSAIAQSSARNQSRYGRASMELRAEPKLSTEDAGRTASKAAALRTELKTMLAANEGNSSQARVLAERIGELEARDARSGSLSDAKRAKQVPFAGKEVRPYAGRSREELSAIVGKHLCQSGQCPTRVAGANARALVQINKKAMAMDPVCGKRISIAQAEHMKHGGKNYYFCHHGCKTAFEAHPDRYSH